MGNQRQSYVRFYFGRHRWRRVLLLCAALLMAACAVVAPLWAFNVESALRWQYTTERVGAQDLWAAQDPSGRWVDADKVPIRGARNYFAQWIEQPVKTTISWRDADLWVRFQIPVQIERVLRVECNGKEVPTDSVPKEVLELIAIAAESGEGEFAKDWAKEKRDLAALIRSKDHKDRAIWWPGVRWTGASYVRQSWWALVILAGLGTCLFVSSLGRSLGRWRRGACATCGYGREGLAIEGPCPECGTASGTGAVETRML